LNHHLYADDTQLFFSFYPSVFDSSITQLQHSLQKISSWKTADLLTLNSTKTEFILVGLPQQLAKINTSSLITTHSAGNHILPLMNTRPVSRRIPPQPPAENVSRRRRRRKKIGAPQGQPKAQTTTQTDGHFRAPPPPHFSRPVTALVN